MTEQKRILQGLSKEGKNAYNKAKQNNNAYILIGNSIYRILADGTREKVETLSESARVRVKQRKFVL